MTKKFLLLLVSIFSFLPLMAQDEIVRRDSSCSYDLDISLIDLFEKRTFVISRITEDPRFMITVGEGEGVFSITSSPEYENIDFYDVFSEFLNETCGDFDILTKVEAAEIFDIDKAKLPEYLLTNLMMGSINRDGNGLCSGALPFCTDVGLYQFPAGVNTGSGEHGPCYDLNKGTAACLHSTPNPAWYYMRIDQPGNINIYMYSTPSYDIDFICWGPFDDYLEPCPHNGTTLLTCDKVVSCSYSADPTETCQIPNSAQTGEYYILLITNYSNQHCNINFSKTSGSGTTDCSIMPPVMEYSDACYGNTLHLSAHEVSNAQYSWTGPNGFTSSLREPHIDNVTFANSGTYSCTVTVPGQGTSDPMTLDIEILPELHADFTVTGAVPGAPAQFTGTETTIPAGNTNKITSRTWDFGDGSQEVSGANPTHVYTTPGTFDVTYTIVAENATGWTCEDSKTTSITVNNNLSAMLSCDDDVLCDGEQTTMHVSASGGTQNYTYNWEPAEFVSNPSSATTSVHPNATTTFTCVISDGYNETEVQHTIEVHPQYPTPFLLDAGESCEPYILQYFNHETQHTEQLVFNESTDELINLGTTHGCDSIIHLTFVKYNTPYAPYINDAERQEVMAGSSWMPLQYKFEIDTVTGAGIEEGIHPAIYNWSIEYHVDWTGIDNTNTWILNEDGTKRATLIVLGPGNATIKCDINTICGTIHREIFVYSQSLGVDDNTYDGRVTIYPNPTNGSFYVSFDESANNKENSVSIYNAAGILVDTFTATSQTTEYKTDDLASGLYFIRITNNDFSVIKRLMINK